jgi:aarF domain-containing kinase
MAARSLWRTRTKLLVVGTALCGGSGAAFIASSDDPSTTLKLCTSIPVRLYRNTVTAASIAFGTETKPLKDNTLHDLFRFNA